MVNHPLLRTGSAAASPVGADFQVADPRDTLARELNDRVIRQLSSAGLALCWLAAVHDEHRLLACVDQIDAAIAHVRSVAFDRNDRDRPNRDPHDDQPPARSEPS